MTKLKFPLEKINEFLSLCSKIETVKDVNYLSTAEYLKFEITMGDCFITKNNLSAFLEYKFDVSRFNFDDIEFLVHEKKLKDFCGTINSEFLYFNISESEKFKEIKISDTEKMKDNKKLDYPFENINIKLFPKTEYRIDNNNRTRISEQVIDSILIAGKHVSNDSLRPMLTCVYLGAFIDNVGIGEGKDIFAADGQLFYSKTFNDFPVNFKPLAIQANELKILNDLKFCDYSVTDTHNIYQTNKNIVYGFRHIENTKGFKYNHFKDASKKINYISINTEDIILFCYRAKSSSTNGNNSGFLSSTCYILPEHKIARFLYTNHETNDEDIKEAMLGEVVGSFVNNKFGINHNQMYDILKILPYQIINISDDEFFLGITTNEDPSYFGFFTKIIDNPNL